MHNEHQLAEIHASIQAGAGLIREFKDQVASLERKIDTMSQALDNLKASTAALTNAVAEAGAKLGSQAPEADIQKAADDVRAATDALNAAVTAAS